MKVLVAMMTGLCFAGGLWALFGGLTACFLIEYGISKSSIAIPAIGLFGSVVFFGVGIYLLKEEL